jgi:hypothetical protein
VKEMVGASLQRLRGPPGSLRVAAPLSAAPWPGELYLGRCACLFGAQPKDDLLKVRIDSAHGAEGNAEAATPEAVSKANDEFIGMISVVGVAKMLDDAERATLSAHNLVAVCSGEEAAKLALPDVHESRIGIGSDGSVASDRWARCSLPPCEPWGMDGAGHAERGGGIRENAGNGLPADPCRSE